MNRSAVGKLAALSLLFVGAPGLPQSNPRTAPFVDVTEASNIAYKVGYTAPSLRGLFAWSLQRATNGGAAAGDCDNDGDIDLFITYGNTGGPEGGGGPNRLYLNQLMERGNVEIVVANAAIFERDWAGRERMDAEFTIAALDPAAARLRGDAVLSLTAYRSPALEGGALLVNGKQLGLSAVNQAIVAALRDVTRLTFDELSARLEDTPRDAVQAAVLDLARYDIVTIQQD